MTPILRRAALAAALVLPAAALAQGFDPMRPGAGYNPMAPAAAPAAEAPNVPLSAEFDDLPDAPGVEDTYYLCSACHSLALVKQQRLTDARWDYLWGWMIEHQGMPEQEPEVRDAILGYLKTYFSSEPS